MFLVAFSEFNYSNLMKRCSKCPTGIFSLVLSYLCCHIDGVLLLNFIVSIMILYIPYEEEQFNIYHKAQQNRVCL